MRQYSNLHPLWMSYYAGEIYEDVGCNWRGPGFRYLFLLLTITWIPVVIMISNQFDDWVDKNLPGIIEQAPEITIEDGKLSTTPSKPFVIDEPSTGKPFIIIDVTGKYTSLEGVEAQFLLLEDRLLFRLETGEIQEAPVFQDVDETVVFNEDVLYQLFDFLKAVLPFVLFPFAVIVSFIYRIVQVCVYAYIGTFFAQYVNTEISYETLLRLSAVSITPAVAIDTLNILMDGALPIPYFYWLLVCLLLSIGYLFFAIRIYAVAELEKQVKSNEEESR